MNPGLLKFSIIIVNWNSTKKLLECLSSISENIHEYRYEVVIVDNHTLNPKEEREIEAFSNTAIIKNKVNLGFSIAVNQGVKAAKGEFVLVLNPDCQLTETSLKPLLNVIETNPSVGMVGPRITKPDGSIVRECRRKHPGLLGRILKYTLLSLLFARLQNFLGFNKWRETYNHSGVTPCIQGSCFLIRKREFLDIGGFDERIPLFLDDMDLCLRYEKEHLNVFFCAESHVIHEGGQSIKNLVNPLDSSLMNFMAFDLYFMKHRGVFYLFGHHLILLVIALVLLPVNLVFLPFLFLLMGKDSLKYLEKHLWMLFYSLTFCFYPKSLPKTWPRCFFRL